MSILRNPSCDRVATALLGARSPLGVGAIVALTAIPEATVIVALRSLAADGIVVRAAGSGRATWELNAGDPRIPILRSLLTKIAAAYDLVGALHEVLAFAPAASRAFLIEGARGAPAHLIVVLPDLFDERWYDLVDTLTATADAAGRTINIEPLSEASYRTADAANPAIVALRNPAAIVLKGTR